MWSSLPSNLRTVLGTALVLGVGVAVAAFALSFFALREAAEDPALRWGSGHAWLFPIGVDMALVFFEVLLLGASMVRVHEDGKVVQYPRAIPFLLVLVAAAATLYFNATRVPEEVRPIALAVPVASILVTLGLAYLLKMLAAASGVEAIHLAPPPMDPRRIVRSRDVLHAEAVRGTPQAQLSRWGSSEASEATGQLGQQWGSGGEVTKGAQVDAYLDAIGPEIAGELKARGITRALQNRGVDVSERYVKQRIDARTGTPGTPGGNGQGHP